MRVGVLERPAARPDVGALRGPVASDIEHLLRLQPSEALLRGGLGRLAARFQERMTGERRVPHGRQAGLAVRLVVRDDKQASRSRRARRRAAGGPAGSRGRRTSCTALAIAGKMAPRPSRPFRRSLTKATAAAMARLRGPSGTADRPAAGPRRSPRRTAPTAASDAGLSATPHISGGVVNNSLIVTPRGLRARGLSAAARGAGPEPSAPNTKSCRGERETSAAAA